MKLINTNPPPFVRGFTLIELLITMAVAGILVTLAVPSYQDTIRQNRLTAQTNELITALNLARGESIRRGQLVNVTPNAGGWDAGWVINAIDPTTNLPTADSPLRSFESLTNNLSFSGGPAAYTFLPSGFKLAGGQDTYLLCDSASSGKRGRRIFVSISGRPRLDINTYTCP